MPAPYADPGIAEFGLANAVFASGDTFLEIVSPVQEGTTAGRYLERRGGDAGYMAIFQVEDLRGARERLGDLGVRVVWQVDLPDMAGTHLHPRDVPGAIVSLDRPDPPDSWRWAGPRWTGSAPADREPGGITGATVTSPDPEGLAARWAAVLGTEADGTTVVLDGGRQQLTFVADDDEGITDVRIAQGGPVREAAVGGVRFHLEEIR
ncbi:MAG: hypothetical protein M3503_01360 [Actinomycetota bacterium]|nr:hypothetical protein [Actinomycetota bacterium]